MRRHFQHNQPPPAPNRFLLGVRYFSRRFLMNFLVVLPITVLFVVWITGVFHGASSLFQDPHAIMLLVLGLFSAVAGLTFFTEGLRLSTMVG
jgi:hypothetical protein